MELPKKEWTHEEVKKKINEALLKADEANIRGNGAAIKADQIEKKLFKKPTYVDVVLASIIVVIIAFLVNGFVFEFRYKDSVAKQIFELQKRVEVLENELAKTSASKQ